ncbi:exocyst complex component 3 isoform X2 [Struthio camelus]|uniref:exocyst complex component 3 isoform X2 n=1 Tax=Struthio camelus TaxID=8801 RepID=UPI0023FC4CD6
MQALLWQKPFCILRQKIPGSAWMMRKMKCSWGLFRRSSSKGEKAAGENARMLPKTAREEGKEQEAKKRGKLKKVGGKLLKAMASGKEAAEKKPENESMAGNCLKIAICRKEVEGKKSAEETICGFIEQGQFFQACNHIYNLECSGSDGVRKSESLYTLLAERMWSVVGQVFSGSDRMLLEPLQSVGESLKWEKQKEEEWFGSSQRMEPVSTWSPRFWKKDLEEKLIKYMTAQLPPFDSASNTDETALKQHLSQLEMMFLPSLEHKSGFFKEAGLLVMYSRCCHACLSSHLSTLTDNDHVSFSQCLLVYEWCLKVYKSGNRTLLGPRQTPHHSLSLDAQCLVWIILKTEEKLLAVTQKEVGEALKEAFDIRKNPCSSAAVIQVLMEKAEAAQRISESLRERVGAVCLEECLSFLESYENEVRSFLQLDGCPGICSGLRILENCCLLRAAWHKLTYMCSASTDQDVKVKGFLDRTEGEIVERLLQTITSKVKRTLKDHFKKCDSGLDLILESLKQSFLAFGKKNTGIYEVLVKDVNAIIITEYVQALLAISRKSSSGQRRRIVSRIEEDHRMLQTIFKECLGPKIDSLKDITKAILGLIQTSDAEGMKIALLPILREFPDLRKEHLSVVLDLKDSLSREDRAALLNIFHDNCGETETNLLFGDIEVKPRTYGLCGCFCC